LLELYTRRVLASEEGELKAARKGEVGRRTPDRELNPDLPASNRIGTYTPYKRNSRCMSVRRPAEGASRKGSSVGPPGEKRGTTAKSRGNEIKGPSGVANFDVP